MKKRFYITIASECLYQKNNENIRYLNEAENINEIKEKANKTIEMLKKRNTLQDFKILKIEEV